MSRYPEPAEILIALIRSRGVRTLREFQAGTLPLPADRLFVTVGNADILAGTPFPFADGAAAGVTLKLRIRLHALRDSGEQELIDLWFDAVLPALADTGLSVRSVQRGDISYNSQIDRLVCEVTVTLEGLLRKTGLQSGKEDVHAPAR